MAPFLLEHPNVNAMFPADAIARAKKLLAAFKGGCGAYSDSRGNPLVRVFWIPDGGYNTCTLCGSACFLYPTGFAGSRSTQ